MKKLNDTNFYIDMVTSSRLYMYIKKPRSFDSRCRGENKRSRVLQCILWDFFMLFWIDENIIMYNWSLYIRYYIDTDRVETLYPIIIYIFIGAISFSRTIKRFIFCRQTTLHSNIIITLIVKVYEQLWFDVINSSVIEHFYKFL